MAAKRNAHRGAPPGDRRSRSRPDRQNPTHDALRSTDDELERVNEELRAELEDLRRALEVERARFLERTTELEEQQRRLEAAVENIPAGLVIVGREQQVLTANDRARQILGVNDLDTPIPSLGWEAYTIDGRRYEPGNFPLERTLATGEVVRNERIELVTPSRRNVVIDVSTAPVLDSEGTAIGAISLFEDVTLQERQERAEREFVTNAAHELQSPLAAIVSAIEVLQAGAKDGPQRDVFLGHIEREADRLARLVRALLILARTQTGLEAPRDELVALGPLLRGIGSGLRPSSSVELHVDCPEELAVLTNRELVEQAVVNLTENAAKHTRSGRIVLSGRQLPDGVVEIGVTDTGAGIAPAERPRIFERFYRGPVTNGTAGFGLGLPIVRAVADALEGELELDSTVGVGTTVRLRLPGAASMVSA